MLGFGGLFLIIVQLHRILVIEINLLLGLQHTIPVLILLHLIGANVIASFSGIVEYTGFYGGGGYTIIIKNGDFTAQYSHLSPVFLCTLGDKILQGQIIGSVGPKNVYDVPNNKYKDNNGNPTNGATTGPHLHFTLKKDGKAVNPLIYLSSS